MDYYVYAHLNPLTLTPFYIGKGRGSRAYDLESIRNKFWLSTVKKYGAIPIIFVDGLNQDQSFEIEKQYISKYGLRIKGGTLTNLTLGGSGGRTIFEHNSEQHRLNSSISKMGDKNPNYGRRIWPEGKVMSEDTKEKIRQSRLGKKLSPEHKEKVLVGLKKASEVSLKSRIHKVECLITGKVWNGRQDCIKELGITLMCYKLRIIHDRPIKGNHLRLIK